MKGTSLILQATVPFCHRLKSFVCSHTAAKIFRISVACKKRMPNVYDLVTSQKLHKTVKACWGTAVELKRNTGDRTQQTGSVRKTWPEALSIKSLSFCPLDACLALQTVAPYNKQCLWSLKECCSLPSLSTPQKFILRTSSIIMVYQRGAQRLAFEAGRTTQKATSDLL